MLIKEGYVYHIKQVFFELIKDNKLMLNHENNSTRPNYFYIKYNNLMWLVPMSSKVQKYKEIISDKIKKYGKCDTIVIGNYKGKNHAFLIQNIFPITEKYIDHIDIVSGKALKVPLATRKLIKSKVNTIFALKSKGINLIFPNIDKIQEKLLNQI